jgi:hypothetical protein
VLAGQTIEPDHSGEDSAAESPGDLASGALADAASDRS